ncbi:MAG: ABC transporter permease [Roseiflexaceae bacterium]|nr:ABC transporter permease [Roseiflexus sp.]MDW8213275.1 ABC transporter permease [Roseiflexaceae bacterium]
MSRAAQQPLRTGDTSITIALKARRWQRAFWRHRSLLVGSVLLAIILCGVAFPSLFTNRSPVVMNIRERLQPPNPTYPFGTDQYGRDMLARVLYGGRTSLVMGVVPILIAAGAGAALGLVAGYHGRWLDALLMRVMDVWIALPIILLALAIVTALGPGLVNIMIAIGVAWIPYYARMVRGVTLSLREHSFIEAARVLGLSEGRILMRHILPNTIAPLIVMSSMGIAGAILTGASLSFIGMGPQAPTPEWGLILADGRQFIRLAWWIGFFPGAAIALTVLGANLLGDGLRDWLDPRMKI